MTRKLLILLAVLTLCLFSLIYSFFGERGFIVNNQLKKQLKENEYEMDRRSVELENLTIQQLELSTEDGLRSAAINLGYQVDTDDVYVFNSDNNSNQTPTQTSTQAASQPETEVTSALPQNATENKEINEIKEFKPWNTGFCLLISFCTSFIITLIILLITKGKRHKNDSQQEESGDTGDNLDLN